MKRKEPLSDYDRARKRVKKKKEFYNNFFSWILVSIFLFGINALTSREHWWAFYPFLGWGLGVAMQALDVFGAPGMAKDWEERKIQEELDKMAADKETRRYLEEGNKSEELELKELERQKKYRDEDLV
jgi:hypothetical protein